MNRRLQILNLIGVAVLALVCVFQWKRDRALNLELNRNEKTRLEQQTKLAEQEKNLRGLTDDLALFKEQLGRAQTEGGEDRKQLTKLEREKQLLAAVRDQLQESVTNWSNAVSARDKLIAEANENIRTLNDRTRTLTEQLNASIKKFNELATNYNAVVGELNTARRPRADGGTNTAAR
jgi:chromosome segregation ATPase